MLEKMGVTAFGHAFFISSNHYHPVRKLIGTFITDSEEKLLTRGIYLLIIINKLKTLPIVDPNDCAASNVSMHPI